VKITGQEGKNAVAFALGFLLMLTPVFMRNYYVTGEWILTTSQAGQNFYTGNNPSNWFGTYHVVPFVRPHPKYEEEDFRTKAEAMTGTRLTAREVSSFWFREAFKHMSQEPVFAAMVVLRKFTLFWSDLEVPDGWGMYLIERYSPALRISPITFGWLVTLSVLGIMASVRHSRDVRLLLGYVIAYSLSVIAFFIFSRYRVYIVPPLAVFAALGIRWIHDQVRTRAWRRTIPGTLAACGACAFTFFGASTFVGLRPENYVHNYVHLAELYQEKGEFNPAKALLYEALERQPQSEVTLCALGDFHLRRNELQEAFLYFHKCIQANEYYPNAWFLLGVTNEKLHNIDEAKRCYQRQLQILSDHRLARMHLENLLIK
jgi:hypothetical protein